MMNVVLTAPSSSECSSGCESGWTLYLEHSSSSFSTGGKKAKNNNRLHCNNKHQKVAATFHQGKKSASLFYDDDDEDEDLSMVSDASSGPPHFDHDIDEDEEDEVFCYSSRKKQGVKLSTLHHQQQYFNAQDFGLDDTASSPLFTSEKKNGGENKGTSLKRMVDYSSQGFSATHFHQERSPNFQEHYGFIQPPFSTNQFQHNQSSLHILPYMNRGPRL